MSREVAGPLMGSFKGSSGLPQEYVRFATSHMPAEMKTKLSRLQKSKSHRPLSQTSIPYQSKRNQKRASYQSDTSKSQTLLPRRAQLAADDAGSLRERDEGGRGKVLALLVCLRKWEFRPLTAEGIHF